jgi:hypothetical protein
MANRFCAVAARPGMRKLVAMPLNDATRSLIGMTYCSATVVPSTGSVRSRARTSATPAADGWSVTPTARVPTGYPARRRIVNWMLSPLARFTTANVKLVAMLPTVEASKEPASSTTRAAVAVMVPTIW